MQNFNGSIDNVKIYNRALSASEITAIYANSSVKYRNTFTYQNNTNLMFSLGYATGQNTVNFDPSNNTLGFSGEKLECYDNETKVLVREEVSREEFMEAIKSSIKNKSAIKGVKKSIQGMKKSIDSELSSEGGESEPKKSPNFLEKIIKKIQEII